METGGGDKNGGGRGEEYKQVRGKNADRCVGENASR